MYEEHVVQFCSLLVLGNDLALYSGLYTSGVPCTGWRGVERGKFQPVRKPTVMKILTKPNIRGDTFVVDDFVVADEEAVEAGDEKPRSPLNGVTGGRTSKTGPGLDRVHGPDDLWTLEWEWLYHLAFLDDDDDDDGNVSTAEERAVQRQNDVSSSGVPNELSLLSQNIARKEETGHRPIETL